MEQLRAHIGRDAGAIVRNPDQSLLRVISFHPGGSNLENPAFELEVIAPGQEPWRGWYRLRQSPPVPLLAAGFLLQPVKPLTNWVSILTINRDPGANLALVGAWCMGIGALLALLSFYDKRQRGDAPDII